MEESTSKRDVTPAGGAKEGYSQDLVAMAKAIIQKSQSGEAPTLSTSNLNPSLPEQLQSAILKHANLGIQTDKTTKSSPDKLSALQSKRIQVPKACSNCRKMHGGCDLQRPCKRCVQNGHESTCTDLPRKKRQSKKRAQIDDQLKYSAENQILNLRNYDGSRSSNDFMINAEIARPAHTQLAELPSQYNFNPITMQNFNNIQNQSAQNFVNLTRDVRSAMNPSTPTTPFTPSETFPSSYSWTPSDVPNPPQIPFNTPQIDLSSTENSSIHQYLTSSSNTYQQPQIKSENIPSKSGFSSNANITNRELNYLFSQLSDLKETNRSLNTKLVGVMDELREIKRSPSTEMLSPMVLNNSIWNSFAPQAELAISVWKENITSRNEKRSTLVEWNDKFTQIMGYSLDVLKSGFSCMKLVQIGNRNTWENLIDDDRNSSRDQPGVAQLVTSTGLKDVYLTKYMLTDPALNESFWIVHILPIS